MKPRPSLTRAATLRATFAEPEVKERHRAAIRRNWAKPAVRAKMVAVRRVQQSSQASPKNLRLAMTPEAQVRAVAGRGAAVERRRAHQRRMVEEMAARAGVTSACRDLSLFREWLSSGLEQKTLAEFLGVIPGSVSGWMLGRKKPRIMR